MEQNVVRNPGMRAKKLTAGLIEHPSPRGGGANPCGSPTLARACILFFLLTVSKVSVSRAAALSRILHLQIKDLPKALSISGPLASSLIQENASLLYGEFR